MSREGREGNILLKSGTESVPRNLVGSTEVVKSLTEILFVDTVGRDVPEADVRFRCLFSLVRRGHCLRDTAKRELGKVSYQSEKLAPNVIVMNCPFDASC